MARQLIAGNWKMNGIGMHLAELRAMVTRLPPGSDERAEIVICPPASLLDRSRAVAGEMMALGGQDCHAKERGAYTGDISAQMLADAGASFVILGHSERRQAHAESDETVAAKARAALSAGLKPIICVGESAVERDGGIAVDVVLSQLKGSIPGGADAERLTIAYEPVWAIGTGKTATVNDIGEMHAAIRQALVSRLGPNGKQVRILYGGSVNPSNAQEILALSEVGGALVGGASLKAEQFLSIIAASHTL